YQFTLPPLVAHAILRQNADILSQWAKSLEPPCGNTTFFNFLASHDGIGIRPAQDYLNQKELDFLVQKTISHGGQISTKNNPDGSKSPYELNINYFSLLASDDLEMSIKKFALAHSILLAMPGVPAIYFHSLFGSINYLKGVEKTGQPRSINREKTNAAELRAELNNKDHRRARIYASLKKMLQIRCRCPPFSPQAEFQIIDLGPKIFAIERKSQSQKIIAIHNLSHKTCTVSLDEPMCDLLDKSHPRSKECRMPPLSYRWMSQF
ncbi:MAG: hypothetical protein JW902_09750, partial [Syntrophaceae bacterium]|nr:hypothetical protein [Syntrophaceae bacterium]